MLRVAWLGLVLVSPSMIGCIGDDGLDPASLPDPAGLLAPPVEAALWNDPQQFPHPAFGWPTLTHVPDDAPEWWRPIDPVEVPADIQGLDHVATAGTAAAGDGFGLFGRIAVNPGFTFTPPVPMEIYDISDPAAPKVLATFEHEFPRRDADILAFPDGRLVVVFTSEAGYLITFDITDPTAPSELSVIDLPTGGHTASFVPGTPILYNANSVGTIGVPLHEAFGGRSTPQTEIYDFTDPATPVLLKEWDNGAGCHGISFHIDPANDRLRGYCAGVDVVQIWDLAEPRDPQVISTFRMPDARAAGPGVGIAHWAVVNADATVLAVADETGGGALPACDAHAEAGGRTVSGPLGNIWFYDISDETAPVLRSWLSPRSHLVDNPPPHGLTPTGSCTAHIGHIVPHAERDLLVMSFYAGGVLLIEFTDPAAPRILDQWTTRGQPSDVWYYNGYIVAGDIDHGLHVLTLR